MVKPLRFVFIIRLRPIENPLLIVFSLIVKKGIYVRKSRGKKTGNKNFGKKSPNFLKSLEKMSLEIKSCVLDSWDFFS